MQKIAGDIDACSIPATSIPASGWHRPGDFWYYSSDRQARGAGRLSLAPRVHGLWRTHRVHRIAVAPAQCRRPEHVRQVRPPQAER